MDKYEFNIKSDKIKKLVERKDYEAAVKIADTIDWERVRNLQILSAVSQAYEEVGRYDEAEDILLMAYECAPAGRRFLYKLTELAIKRKDFDEAEEYLKDFSAASPKDPSRLILRYEISRAKGEPPERQIMILEAYQKRGDFEERWSYELAALYHRVGKDDQCVKLCDEIILWFGVGTYVDKAMELKQLIAPLTPDQIERQENKDKYLARLEEVQQEFDAQGVEEKEEPDQKESKVEKDMEKRDTAAVSEESTPDRKEPRASQVCVQDVSPERKKGKASRPDDNEEEESDKLYRSLSSAIQNVSSGRQQAERDAAEEKVRSDAIALALQAEMEASLAREIETVVTNQQDEEPDPMLEMPDEMDEAFYQEAGYGTSFDTAEFEIDLSGLEDLSDTLEFGMKGEDLSAEENEAEKKAGSMPGLNEYKVSMEEELVALTSQAMHRLEEIEKEGRGAEGASGEQSAAEREIAAAATSEDVFARLTAAVEQAVARQLQSFMDSLTAAAVSESVPEYSDLVENSVEKVEKVADSNENTENPGQMTDIIQKETDEAAEEPEEFKPLKGDAAKEETESRTPEEEPLEEAAEEETLAEEEMEEASGEGSEEAAAEEDAEVSQEEASTEETEQEPVSEEPAEEIPEAVETAVCEAEAEEPEEVAQETSEEEAAAEETAQEEREPAETQVAETSGEQDESKETEEPCKEADTSAADAGQKIREHYILISSREENTGLHRGVDKIKEMHRQKNRPATQVARITGEKLAFKEIGQVLRKLEGRDLVIVGVADLPADLLVETVRLVEQSVVDGFIAMIGTPEEMAALQARVPFFANCVVFSDAVPEGEMPAAASEKEPEMGGQSEEEAPVTAVGEEEASDMEEAEAEEKQEPETIPEAEPVTGPEADWPEGFESVMAELARFVEEETAEEERERQEQKPQETPAEEEPGPQPEEPQSTEDEASEEEDDEEESPRTKRTLAQMVRDALGLGGDWSEDGDEDEEDETAEDSEGTAEEPEEDVPPIKSRGRVTYAEEETAHTGGREKARSEEELSADEEGAPVAGENDRAEAEPTVAAPSEEERPSRGVAKGGAHETHGAQGAVHHEAAPSSAHRRHPMPNPSADGEMSNKEFFDFAVHYARMLDAEVDDMGGLAIYAEAEQYQQERIPLTEELAQEIIEKAILRAERHSIKNLLSSRYNKEGYLILKEEHFKE